MNKIKSVIFVLAALSSTNLPMASASEITGDLSTGISGTVGNVLTGNVIVPYSSPSSGGGGISGGGSNILKITKAEPRVAGIATEDISQMTREEKLQRIAEIRLLLIQLIQQLIAELQKQLVAIKS